MPNLKVLRALGFRISIPAEALMPRSHHVVHLILLHRPGGLTAFIVDHRAVAQSGIEHPIEDVGWPASVNTSTERWDSTVGIRFFLFFRVMSRILTAQIHLRIVGKILQPRQNVGIGKEILFHA